MKIDKTSLFKKLQKAIELELATIPPYLMAVFSIHSDANRTPSAIIRSVFMEEMLHLTLAGNLLSAVGGKVKLGKDTIPVYPLRMEFDGKGLRDREFDINLAKFEKSTIDTFRQIELPDWGDERDLNLTRKNFQVEGYTIGEFYESIQKDLKDLCKKYPDREVFSGNPAHQISEDYYWGGGGKPIVIKHLKSALKAVDEIIEQGEGANGSMWDGDEAFGQEPELAHYFRFNEIYHERHYKDTDCYKDNPSGAKLKIDWDKVYPIKPNCKATDFDNSPKLAALNEAFNLKYSTMLAQLENGFNGNPKVFYTAIMNGMHDLSPIASKMVQLPIVGDPENRNGAPSFEWINPKIIENNNSTGVDTSITGPEKKWHVIQTVELGASAQEVWDLIGGFFTIHTWHPDISTTKISNSQTEGQAILRHLTFSGPPVSLTTEQLDVLDNANWFYKYKWHDGAWGEAIKDYHSEIRIFELVPDKQCMVQWSSTFIYTSDAVSAFYQNGFAALKKKFGEGGSK